MTTQAPDLPIVPLTAALSIAEVPSLAPLLAALSDDLLQRLRSSIQGDLKRLNEVGDINLGAWVPTLAEDVLDLQLEVEGGVQLVIQFPVAGRPLASESARLRVSLRLPLVAASDLDENAHGGTPSSVCENPEGTPAAGSASVDPAAGSGGAR